MTSHMGTTPNNIYLAATDLWEFYEEPIRAHTGAWHGLEYLKISLIRSAATLFRYVWWWRRMRISESQHLLYETVMTEKNASTSPATSTSCLLQLSSTGINTPGNSGALHQVTAAPSTR